ncbi:hypothetical protein BJ912DRAFT_948845, partial [Pholiota molesta]
SVTEGQGFVLIYSITSRSTFERVKVFREFVRNLTQGDPIFMLVGNKCDRTHDRVVTQGRRRCFGA